MSKCNTPKQPIKDYINMIEGIASVVPRLPLDGASSAVQVRGVNRLFRGVNRLFIGVHVDLLRQYRWRGGEHALHLYHCALRVCCAVCAMPLCAKIKNHL